MKKLPAYVIGFLLCAGAAAPAIDIGSLAGDWTAVRADVEEMSLKWHKAQLEFSSFRDGRPFDSGEWDLRGDSLFLYGSAGASRYRVWLAGDTMRMAGGKWTQVFVKKEEWQELLIFGTRTATSTLKGEDWFGENIPAYSVRNMGDGDPATCWAEGVPGTGVGEKIYLVVKGKPGRLSMVNGYGKSAALYARNARVKAFRATALAAFNLPGDVSEVATKYHIRKCGPAVKLEARDIQARQGIALPFDWANIEKTAGELAASFDKDFAAQIADRSHGCEDRFYRATILELEIAEVYGGTKYEDTCLSEIDLE
ncbi:MAG TPA: hypothetical protein DDW31_02545 [candidate division Zixibacteria bacterium]|nr:hypothetical protein [candidate division Zixibacteria bacterium]